MASAPGNNGLSVSLSEGLRQAVAAEQDRLLFANSFPASDMATASYVIVSVTKEVMFNPEHTVLHIFGKAEDGVAEELGSYFAGVKQLS